MEAHFKLNAEQTGIETSGIVFKMNPFDECSIEAGRLLCHKSSWQLDNGINPTFTASCAKAFCADMTMKTTTDAVQIFGGYGYSKEYPVEKLMRDAKIIQIYDGTSQIQCIVIAREVLK